MTKKPYLIRFDDDVHHELKVFAVTRKLKLNDAIKMLLQAYKLMEYTANKIQEQQHKEEK